MQIVHASVAVLLSSAALFGAAKSSTYSKDVAPILNKRCVECHRPGEAAPMTFQSFKEVRPWAKAIKGAVLAKKMPPWLADPNHGRFANDRRLAQSEIDTIVSWADNGAPEGDPKDLPPAPEFITGWNIGKPDMIIDIGRDYAVPSDGTVAYQYFIVDPGLKEDVWVEAAEARPDKRSVVHHIIAFVMDPKENLAGSGGNLLVGWAPGDPPVVFQPGTAKLLRAGSKLRFQMHYTTNGKPATDRSYIGLRLAKNPPKYRAYTGNAINFGFRIPAGDPNYEVKSSFTAKEDIRLNGLMPHMHVRGKDFQYTVVYPDGRSQVLLSVPKYDFNWQLGYRFEEPLLLPKGTRIDCVAHYDNSPNNKYNPDPTKEVRWGDQTWEEMMIGWFDYTIEWKPQPAATGAGAGEE